MSTITFVEQTTPSAPSANQQKIYPKVGALARVDSTGTEKIILDSSTYAAAVSAVATQCVYWGI